MVFLSMSIKPVAAGDSSPGLETALIAPLAIGLIVFVKWMDQGKGRN